MKIVVCVKVSGGEINPFDESALECALSLSDDVTVVSMASEAARNVLLPLTRLGAKVVLISDNLYAGSDTLATAYILSEAIKKMEFDLILCGKQSVDGDTAQVGPMIAAKLNLHLITNALKVNISDNVVSAKTREKEERADLPALITVERGYVLRFPSIFSKTTEITLLDNSAINCEKSRCGLAGSPTRVIKTFENNSGRRNCRFIGFHELEPLIAELLQKKVPDKHAVKRKNKLKSVWAIGNEVAEKAHEIAENVIVIDKSEPEFIVNRAKLEKPEVVLWNADLWGRKTAPVAAAMLDTGICADCTELDVEDGRLIMYRPARGNSIYAKIVCNSMPQMATVRTKSESADIIISGGKGVADKTDRLKDFAAKFNAELGSSRGLVDMGKMPYNLQVGLTGRTVSPKIYVAVGISGAAYHTCAIENADTVIAINPDKNARIFDYADYGIVDKF